MMILTSFALLIPAFSLVTPTAYAIVSPLTQLPYPALKVQPKLRFVS